MISSLSKETATEYLNHISQQVPRIHALKTDAKFHFSLGACFLVFGHERREAEPCSYKYQTR